MDLSKYRQLFLHQSEDILDKLQRLPSDPALWQEPHCQEAARQVHTLKGMAGTMGYPSLVALCQRVEEYWVALTAHDWDQALIGIAGHLAEVRGGPPRPRTVTLAQPTPPSDDSIRVPRQRLDRLESLVTELQLLLHHLKRDAEPGEMPLLVGLHGKVLELAEVSEHLQRLPVQTLTQPFTRSVPELARQLGKRVEFEVSGADIELDRGAILALAEPLTHLLRNAVDHGIEAPAQRKAAGKPEAGRLLLAVRQDHGHVTLQLQDDGCGIDPQQVRRRAVALGLLSQEQAQHLSSRECLALLFRPGYSSRDTATEVSGRGVGLDSVATAAARMGGQVSLESTVGVGTTLTLRLPFRFAVVGVFLVQDGGLTYGVPVKAVERILSTEFLPDSGQQRTMPHPHSVTGQTIPLLRLGEYLRGSRSAPAGQTGSEVLVTKLAGEWYGLEVESVLGEEEVPVRPLPAPVNRRGEYLGGTLLPDNRVAYIINPRL